MVIFSGIEIRSIASFLATAAVGLSQPVAPSGPAEFDPSDRFFQGHLAARASENLEKNGDFREAMEKMESAHDLLGTIQKFHPQWKPDMVSNRKSKIAGSLARLRVVEAEAAIEKEHVEVASLEGGTRTGTTPVSIQQPVDVLVPTPPIQTSMPRKDPLPLNTASDTHADAHGIRHDPPKMPLNSAHDTHADAERERMKKQITAIGSLPPAVQSEPSDHTTWTAYAGVMENLAAMGSGGYTYVLHKQGGTSVYLRLVHDDKIIGAILPENSATSIEGEITSWNVARHLGFPEISQPASLITLKGHALQVFREQLASSSFRGHKEKNRKAVLGRIDSNPSGIPTVFKQWLPLRPVGLDSLVSGGRFRSDTRLAGFLRHDEPMPGEEAMSFNEVRDAEAPESELARQMSNILLADALVGQWDRFSGGNIHAYAVDGRLRLASLDNGGASVTSGSGYLDRFEDRVTRFDKQSVENLLAMRAFLKGESANFAEKYEDPSAFIEALGFSKRNHERFMARVNRVADHVEACVKREGGLFK